jgi:hypothetical protein
LEAAGAAGAPPSPPTALTRIAAQLTDIRELLGPAWILEGEDPKRYEGLLLRVAEAVGPIDFIDWLLVKDVVALTWEIQRSRRHRETLIRMGRLKALEQILEQAMPRKDDYLSIGCGPGDIPALAARWLSGDSKATKEVVEMLPKSGFSVADITTHAMTVRAVELERIDLQVERHESRRDSLLRQIERRREGWAKRVQTEDAVEAEFREVPARDSEPLAAVGGGGSGA